MAVEVATHLQTVLQGVWAAEGLPPSEASRLGTLAVRLAMRAMRTGTGKGDGSGSGSGSGKTKTETATVMNVGLDVDVGIDVEAAVRLLEGLKLSDLTQRLAAAAEACDLAAGSAKACVWRNIHYGEAESSHKLSVFKEPKRTSEQGSVGLAFGERFRVAVKNEFRDGEDLWLQLADGLLADYWVLAEEAEAVHCLRLQPHEPWRGPLAASAFRGQAYPKGMFSDGYDGSADVCLVSASVDAFWREVNQMMLAHDIATATVFEKQWGGDASFTDWVAFYAANVTAYGRLKTSEKPRRLLVTVKHTKKWQQFQLGCTHGRDIKNMEDLRPHLGRTQFQECVWLQSQTLRLGVRWEEMEFITAFSFLRSYGGWTVADCRSAAVDRLHALKAEWEKLEEVERGYQVESVFWCLHEAFFDTETPSEPEVAPAQWVPVLVPLLATQPGLLKSVTKAMALDCPQALADRQWILKHAESFATVTDELAKIIKQGKIQERKMVMDLLGQVHGPAAAVASHLGRVVAASGRVMAVSGVCGQSAEVSLHSLQMTEKSTWQNVKTKSSQGGCGIGYGGADIWGGTAVACGGRVYVLGWGRTSHSNQNIDTDIGESLSSFDLKSGIWKRENSTSMKVVRRAVTTLGGKLMAIGGMRVVHSFSKAYRDLSAMGTVECYDLAARCWEGKGPRPMKQGRYSLAAATLLGKVYALGGARVEQGLGKSIVIKEEVPSMSGPACDNAEVYDPASDTWRSLPSMKEARKDFVAVGLGERVFVLGGVGGSSGRDALPFLEAFNPATNAWETLSRRSPFEGGSLSAVARHGQLYVLSKYGELQRYDPQGYKDKEKENEAWERLPPLCLGGSRFVQLVSGDEL